MTAIIVGAVATFVFGFLWYGPLFGKQWMKLSGNTPEKMEGGKMEGMAGKMVTSAVLSLITSGVVSWLLPVLAPVSFEDFLKWILLIWLGFIFPMLMRGNLWEKKSLNLVLFYVVETALGFTLLSAIIYYWK